jgi:hypothetical protein
MVEEDELVGYSPDQQNYRLPIWTPKETKPAAKTSVVFSPPAPEGGCEFTGDIAFAGCICKLRLCQIDGTSCTFACYSDSKVWSRCWTRLQKLKDKEQI